MIKRLLVIVLCALMIQPAYAGSVTGLLQSGGGQVLPNATLTFTPTMFAILAGSFVQTAASINCYTDALGNVVGLPNPLVQPTAAAANAGTLTAATNYFLQFTYTGPGTESAPSPELVFNLPGGQSSINFTAPVLQPVGATGYKVWASLTSGGEKLQQTVTGFGNTSITSLLSVTSPPSSNNTVCSFNFSDSLIPQARYVLGIVDSNGSTVPGFPQTYYTTGATFNLNSAFPTANTNAIFPNAIVSNPSGATQSIFSNLNLNGFGLTAGIITGNSGVLQIIATNSFNIGAPRWSFDAANNTFRSGSIAPITWASGPFSNGVSSDTGISRDTVAGFIDIGNGTQGDISGGIKAASLSLGGGTALTTTNRTGTNNLVLSTSPTIATPTLTSPTTTGTDSGVETFISKVLLGAGVSNSVTLITACKFDNAAAIVGTGADVSIFTCTFPANVLPAGKCFHTRGSWQHTTGAAGVTYKFTFGSQTQSAAAEAGTGVVTWDIDVCNKNGVTNAQTITGIAGFDGITPIFGNIFLAGTNDTTTGITLKFTFSVAATDQVTPLQMDTWLDQ